MSRSLCLGLALAAVAVLAALLPATGALARQAPAPTHLELINFTFPPARTVSASAARPARRPRPARRRLEGTLLVHVRAGRSAILRSAPGVALVARLGARTEFGSATVAPALAVRGRWLGVSSPALPNGRLGWIDARSDAIMLSHSRMWIDVDRAARRLRLYDGRRVVLSAVVGVGSPSSPTPAGRFAVTDRLAGGRFSPAYGCCVLPISAHQEHPPAGWANGTRMAIHGTNDPATIGQAASAGCVHAEESTIRALAQRVPLGTPVLIR